MLMLSLTGCDDEFYDDYDPGYNYNGDNDHFDDYDHYDNHDHYDSDEYYDGYDYEGYGMESPIDANLSFSDFPLGTCGEMEGTTLLVSVFLNDSDTSWDGCESVMYDALNYTGIATDWISTSTSAYGCNCDFIYDWTENEDLYFAGTIDTKMFGSDVNPDSVDYSAWEFIDEYIDSQALLEKYNADNIGYMLYLNTPKSNNMTSCTRNYYEGMAYPYEICYIYMFFDEQEEAPAGIAHEILHTFGAPDLYLEDTDGENYGVSKSLVQELENTRSNDIMYATYDIDKYISHYDKITNDFTELDAYYVGIIDSCDFVNEWNLQPSQHN